MKRGLLIQKKNDDDDKLEIIRLFHGLHVKQKIKSSNPFFWSFCQFFKLRLLLGLLRVSFSGDCLKFIFSCEHYLLSNDAFETANQENYRTNENASIKLVLRNGSHRDSESSL